MHTINVETQTLVATHVFKGIKTDVTVAESSNVLQQFKFEPKLFKNM